MAWGVKTAKELLEARQLWREQTKQKREEQSASRAFLVTRPWKDHLGDAPNYWLNWDRKLTQLIGRESETKALLDWAKTARQEEAVLVHGKGGQGKTRLLAEVADQLRKEGWDAGFVRWGAEAWTKPNAKTFAILDYPEEHSEEAKALVTSGSEVRWALASRRPEEFWRGQLNRSLGNSIYLESLEPPKAAELWLETFNNIPILDKPAEPTEADVEKYFSNLREQQKEFMLRPLFIQATAIAYSTSKSSLMDLTPKSVLDALVERELMRIKSESGDWFGSLQKLLALSATVPGGLRHRHIASLIEKNLLEAPNPLEKIEQTSYWVEDRLILDLPDVVAMSFSYQIFGQMIEKDIEAWLSVGTHERNIASHVRLLEDLTDLETAEPRELRGRKKAQLGKSMRTVSSWKTPRLPDQQLNQFHYNALIATASRGNNYAEAKNWFEAMKDAEVKPDVATYTTLITAAPTYAEANSWLKTMLDAEVKPDVVTYTTLITAAPTYAEANSWLKTMLDAEVKPDVVTYNTLIKAAPSYEEAEIWFEAMTDAEIKPDVVTYNTLIEAAPSYEEAEIWFEAMTVTKVQPSVITYNTLINAAPSYEEAETWFEAMTDAEVKPDVVTYNTLIKATPSYEMAKGWFETMMDAEARPDVFTYNTLINAAPSYEEAEIWFEAMTDAEVKPNVITYNTLIKAAPSYEEAVKWGEEMEKNDIQLSNESYGSIFTKDLSMVSASSALEWFWSRGYHYWKCVEPLIAVYRRNGKLLDALEVAMFYPQLKIAISLFVNNEGESTKFLETSSRDKDTSRRASALYALGLLQKQLGTENANETLLKALDLADSAGRKQAILDATVAELDQDGWLTCLK